VLLLGNGTFLDLTSVTVRGRPDAWMVEPESVWAGLAPEALPPTWPEAPTDEGDLLSERVCRRHQRQSETSLASLQSDDVLELVIPVAYLYPAVALQQLECSVEVGLGDSAVVPCSVVGLHLPWPLAAEAASMGIRQL